VASGLSAQTVRGGQSYGPGPASHEPLGLSHRVRVSPSHCDVGWHQPPAQAAAAAAAAAAPAPAALRITGMITATRRCISSSWSWNRFIVGIRSLRSDPESGPGPGPAGGGHGPAPPGPVSAKMPPGCYTLFIINKAGGLIYTRVSCRP
jgi:hypothetical protein